MKILGFILGVVIAGSGGVLLYRALFLEPSAGYVITETNVREFPNSARVIGSTVLLILGAAIAFFSLKRTNRGE
jgi:hypothetical protein